jgi:hypothetical protein
MSRETPLACPVPAQHADEPPAQPVVMLATRFLLELIGFAAIGWAGWNLGGGGIAGGALAALLVITAGAAWGALTVPGDPARNPTPVIVVPGWARLLIEAAIFGLAAWALWIFVSRAASETYLTALGIVSLVGWDRIWWLVKQRP